MEKGKLSNEEEEKLCFNDRIEYKLDKIKYFNMESVNTILGFIILFLLYGIIGVLDKNYFWATIGFLMALVSYLIAIIVLIMSSYKNFKITKKYRERIK